MTTLQEKSTGKARTGAALSARRSSPFRWNVISAVFKRNFFSYFSNPAGYVFITVFVSACAGILFWQDDFFSRNLDNLDLLNDKMPYLLLFFIPAVTMSVWAEERRQGTDELLFTLPAHDLDVVIGKYLAALGIYTVALFFSLSLVVILGGLGKPDPGVIFASYFGYWLMGVLLIPIGMVASLLSSNATVAFIMGSLFCVITVVLGVLGTVLGRTMRLQLEDLSLPGQFRDFGSGVIPLSGVLYALSLAACFLYVNMALLGRRHWAGGQKSKGLWVHTLVRVSALVAALLSFNILVGRAGARADVSEGHLNSLSRESVALVKQIPKDRPVYIQAYVSPEVPREFVETKADLVNLLREYAARGGDKVRLNVVETELYSAEARDAEKRFGIVPRRVVTNDESRTSSAEFYLGVAFSSGLEEVVIPFFDRGLPVEYELTRSIRVVSRTARKKVGILSTDAKLMGGFDMKTMGQNPEWSIVTELKKQYDVSSVAADQPIATDLDVLLVAQPSSLSQKQIDTLTEYVKRGGPALLFLDPLPMENPQLSPEVPKQAPGGPFGGQPPEQKGDLQPLLDLIGLDWPTTKIVWNDYNPLQKRPDLPPEIIFISPNSGAEDAFNSKEAATSGLQEVVAIFAGHLRSKAAGAIEFTPLLSTNDRGGTVDWDKMVRQGFMGISGINPNPPLVPARNPLTIAARLQGAPAKTDKDQGKKKEKGKADEKPAEIKVIAIADLDMISEQFFEMRRQKVENLELDNVTFVLNCVDVLAGDESFVALRKRRLKHRTLVKLEEQVAKFDRERQDQTKAAELAAEDQLKIAQERFNKQVNELRERKDVDERTKEIMLSSLETVTNRRLDVEKSKIEDEKRRKIQESKAEMERKRREIQSGIRLMAIGIPPLPALLLGLIVFGIRFNKENLGANPNRLA